MRNAASKVITPSNRSMGAVLRVWAVVVLDAAAPGYACSGWGGPGDGEKGRERSGRGSVTFLLPPYQR